jgi:hypothetical protein
MFNIIGEREDMQTKLPGFSLRNADPTGVASALNTLLTPRGLTLTPSGLGVYVLRKTWIPVAQSNSNPSKLPNI